MLLNIFNVDHGACALVTTSNGRRVLIDCGHHAEERWLPGAALNSMGIYNIDRLFITNFDEDHCSGIGDLLSRVFVQALVTNNTITSQAVREMKSANGMGNGIRRLIESMERTFTGGPVSAVDDANFGDASFSVFRNPYDPYFGFSDTNNLSLAIFIRCGPHKIVFPGDLEVRGWKALMQNPAFARELRDVTLFVASHHGRLNGYSREVMEACPNIQAVIFSDDGIAYQTQETVDLYRQHANGIIFDGKLRRVLTTRRDRSMIFHLNEAGGGTVSLNVAA
ncbi:beta-lactamase superfamily II metal-dependent hydrolase [Rhodovulum imhoffii]|uniref:Beta-lactamase superfamily II metal-dependent hydrolase n=1 Tax=Rhodovulum imhoffii TaxID=365340 RepID=A0A2T5BX18_9RHOB|nr:MBL fold metallo-hydrolase [Rhodovulum imhoffii]PTN04162.1 beta-lactamase superfamily II metal-dependent hydrolase [Rhodovulum imhoffii]